MYWLQIGLSLLFQSPFERSQKALKAIEKDWQMLRSNNANSWGAASETFVHQLRYASKSSPMFRFTNLCDMLCPWSEYIQTDHEHNVPDCWTQESSLCYVLLSLWICCLETVAMRMVVKVVPTNSLLWYVTEHGLCYEQCFATRALQTAKMVC